MSDIVVVQLLSRAEAALQLRRWAEAERSSRGALAADPGNERGHAALSLALSPQGRHDEAIATTERGLAANPESERLHRVRSIALFKAGRVRDALGAADEAVRLLPSAGAGHHLRSLALKALRRIGEARAAAERAVALSPETAEFHTQLGDAWLSEDAARAERNYRESLKIAPESAETLNNLGVALRKQGRNAEATLAFQSALLLDPGIAPPKQNLFVATNPFLRAPRPLRVAVALALVGELVFGVLGLRGAPFLPVLGGMLVCLVLMLVLGAQATKIGLRQLEALDPELTRLRRRISADIDSGAINPVLHRRLAIGVLVFGAVTVLAAAVVEALVMRQYLAFPKAPRKVTVEASYPDEWVELEGAELDCGSRLELRGHTYYRGRSAGGRAFVACYDELLSCDRASAKMVGVISDLHPNLAATLTKSGFAVPANRPASLCVACGPKDTLIGNLALPLLAALGAVLVRAGVRNLRRLPSRPRG